MQPTAHSSNKNIIEKEQRLLFSLWWWSKSHRIFKAPYTEILQGFPGELSHQYGNENFKFILFSQWEKNQSRGIEALWSMERFTCWEPDWSDIIYLLRIKYPLGNEQFHPLKIWVRAGGIIRKSNSVVKNAENTSAIYWHENIKVGEKLGSSAWIQTSREEAVCFNHVKLRYL